MQDDQARIAQQKAADKALLDAQRAAAAQQKAADKALLAAQKGKFGKSRVTKRLKQLCKKHHIRLTVKRGGKRYPKSLKQLKQQLKNK